MSGRLILVWGGSGSGKSAWAERRLLSLAGRSEEHTSELQSLYS